MGNHHKLSATSYGTSSAVHHIIDCIYLKYNFNGPRARPGQSKATEEDWMAKSSDEVGLNSLSNDPQ